MSEDSRPANDPADYFKTEKSWLLQSVLVGGGEGGGELVDILVEEGKIVRVEANIGVGPETRLIAGEGRRGGEARNALNVGVENKFLLGAWGANIEHKT